MHTKSIQLMMGIKLARLLLSASKIIMIKRSRMPTWKKSDWECVAFMHYITVQSKRAQVCVNLCWTVQAEPYTSIKHKIKELGYFVLSIHIPLWQLGSASIYDTLFKNSSD